MVDVVVNHNAWSGPPETVNYSRFIPFDQPEYYHTTHCSIDYGNMGDIVSPPVMVVASQSTGPFAAYGLVCHADLSTEAVDAVLGRG